MGDLSSAKIRKLMLARANEKPVASNTKKALTIAQVENLFVEKFQEKYKLTSRDISRAFKRFDKDGNSTLDVQNLADAIYMFLNGIDISIVRELVSRYDVDGDGIISIDEFTQFLLSRTSSNKEDWLTVDQLTSSSTKARTADATNYNSNHNNKELYSRSQSEVSYASSIPTDQAAAEKLIEYKVKIFLTNLKAILIKKVNENKNSGKVSSADRLSYHTNQLMESNARILMSKAFLPYTQSKGTTTVDFVTFNRVLSKFTYPGAQPPHESIIKFLFTSCSNDCLRNPQLLDTSAKADPDVLVDLIFDTGGAVINQFGFRQPITAASNTGRPAVGNGPIIINPASKLGIQISDIPFRYVTKHCRTSLAVPSNFNIHQLNRSAVLPSYDCIRSKVYGLNNNMYCGEPIHSLSMYNTMQDTILYSSASLGILHNTVTDSQIFLEGHNDDISCIASSSDGMLIATGCVGKSPDICIWDTLSCSSRNTSSSVLRLGKGFFQRGVGGVAFSYDSKYINGISCDDKHEMGIWQLSTGQLVTSVSIVNGMPPQVKSCIWSQTQYTTAMIAKEHSSSPCDVIVTVCEKHIKFWSFQRPTIGKGSSSSSSLIMGRSTRMGKVQAEPPRSYLCAVYSSNGYNNCNASCDLYAGGDNGHLYLFRDLVCIRASNVINNGSVTSVQSSATDGYVVCGCSGGVIKLVDGSNLTVLKTFSILPKIQPELPATAGAAIRPSSSHSSGGNSSSSSSKPGIRPSTATNANRNKSVGKGIAKSAAQLTTISLSHTKQEVIPDGIKSTSEITGMALQYDNGQLKSVFVSTGFGRLISVDIEIPSAEPATVLYYHFGPVYGLCVNHDGLVATGGDDKWLCVWNANRSNALVVRTMTRAPIRCCDFSSSGASNFLAVGHVSGIVSVYYLDVKYNKNTSVAFMRSMRENTDYRIQLLASAKDCTEDISDIKFSPNSKMLAVGNHDNYIDIYATGLEAQTTDSSAACKLRYLKRIKGHSSYVTHLDWSFDNKLIQSTSASYEILYFDVSTGKQLLSSTDTLEADTVWYTKTCELGFGVMGIWQRYHDGTDVNAIDVSKSLKICASGDDSGHVNIFNYPCVIKEAPRITLSGHSSHVMNVKFIHDSSGKSDASVSLASVGGDGSVMLWNIV